GLVIPGASGADKNLCDFATENEACKVDPDVAELLTDLHRKSRPIAALCIAPTILASLFGEKHKPELTIGKDPETATLLEKMGARHQAVEPTQIVIDPENRLVSSPCYMTTGRIGDVALCAEKTVNALLSMVHEPVGA
ncbi:MAG: isoprenoid biosynthesis protein ElbB, partial [Candidatus Eisenbacteria bacterium]|nr:isoprenoid biosynthesis protein ElbB [Candidatus Eisenbacteria bacterium]